MDQRIFGIAGDCFNVNCNGFIDLSYRIPLLRPLEQSPYLLLAEIKSFHRSPPGN